MNYNTLDKPTTAAQNDLFWTIMDAIGTTPVNGIAKRVDILAVQEQTNFIGGVNTAANMAAVLNSHYAGANYTAILNGTGNDRTAFIYDQTTVQFITSSTFPVVTRPGFWMKVRPAGYTSTDADLNLYTLHLKAGSAADNLDTREFEAGQVRTHAAGLSPNLIYMGDFNIGSSTDVNDAHDELMVAGTNQPIDPVNQPTWPNSTTNVSRILTQSTRTTMLSDGGAIGGVDDRFDLHYVTAPLMDGEGLSYIGPTVPGTGAAHSYRAFGNDGTSYNQAITAPATGRSQSATVLSALFNYSDHLPVVADYQLPAKMDAFAGSVPATIDLGEAFSVNVTVSNIANVVAAVGADELDYSVSTSGTSLSGSYSDQMDAALGGVNMHSITLDTSTIGMKSGTVTVSSTSQAVQTTAAVQDGTISIPISYIVVLPGDYNVNGVVDAADYVVWRDTLGTNPSSSGFGADGDRSGVVDEGDYIVWRSHFGQMASGSGASFDLAAVPEPSAFGLLVVAACLFSGRATTLRAWTRKR